MIIDYANAGIQYLVLSIWLQASAFSWLENLLFESAMNKPNTNYQVPSADYQAGQNELRIQPQS
jgi:hypothetical protein